MSFKFFGHSEAYECNIEPMAGIRHRLTELGRTLKARVRYYRAIYGDPRTPFLSRALLWLAVGYALLPFDLIPDFIPVIGHLDDLIVIPALVILAMKLVPAAVQEEHRHLLEER